MGKDYYSTLQITRSANESEIKAAYRKIALNFHPIKNPGDKHAVEKFKDSAEAYDVLSHRKQIGDLYYYLLFENSQNKSPEGKKSIKLIPNIGYLGQLSQWFLGFLSK